MKSVACVNLKGGVGKTAIAVNFAAYCGSIGKRTLLVDLDPQANATFSCMDVDKWEIITAKQGSIADLLDMRSYTSAEGKTRDVKSVIVNNAFHNVDLIPSHLDLFTIDLDLAGTTARETKLRRALAPIANEYDIIVCDCPPNLTIPTQNALAFCSHYIVPISPDYLSGLGVGLLLQRVKRICEALEHSLEFAGIVISRVGRPAAHRAETVAALREQFKDRVLGTEIKDRVVVSESAAQHKPVYDMGDSDASREFKLVSAEILRIIGASK